MTDPIPKDQQSELDLRYREHALNAAELERRHKLDSSFPKKWGAVFWPGMVTLLVAIVSSAYKNFEHQTTLRMNALAAEETKRLGIEAAKETARLKSIENGRAAVEMYFENPELFSGEHDNVMAHLEMLIAISDNSGLVRAFLGVSDKHRSDRARSTDQDQLAELADGQAALVEGLPTILGENWEEAPAYTVYVQYAKGEKCRQLGLNIQSGLRDLGFRVPGIEGITKEGVPYNTQVRFYTESQRDLFADSLEQNLPKMVTLDPPLSVKPVMLSGDLPGGTFEVWLGRNDCEG